eukprot:9619684-Lingulodinium_polyedra.AAC.1
MGARPCPCGHHRPRSPAGGRYDPCVLKEPFGTAPAALARGLTAWTKAHTDPEWPRGHQTIAMATPVAVL